MTFQPTFLMRLCNLLAGLISIYIFLLWIRIFLSWIFRGYVGNPIINFLYRITDPFLNLFRGARMRIGMLDFTPILGFMLLSVCETLLKLYAAFGVLTLSTVMVTLLQTLHGYIISPFMFLLIVALAVRLFLCFRATANSILMIRTLDTFLGGILNFVQRMFYGSKPASDRNIVTIALIGAIVVNIALGGLFRLLYRLLLTI